MRYAEQALEIRRSTLGELDPGTAASLHRVSASLLDIGDKHGARDAAGEALVNRRSVLGERHPDTAESLDWIGIVCNALDDVRGALESASPALAIRLEASGETHPETLSSRVDVATALINVQKKTLADQVVTAGLKHAPEHRELRRLKSPLDGKPTPRPSTPSKRKR